MPTDPFPTIDLEALARVSGGTTSNDQITAALSAITNSLSQLSANRNQTDPTMMMMMMMMMMGGGGGGGVVAGPGVAAGPGAGPPVINVDTSVLSRAGGLAGLLNGGGGYGYGGGGCCGCGCKCW